MVAGQVCDDAGVERGRRFDCAELEVSFEDVLKLYEGCVETRKKESERSKKQRAAEKAAREAKKEED